MILFSVYYFFVFVNYKMQSNKRQRVNRETDEKGVDYQEIHSMPKVSDPILGLINTRFRRYIPYRGIHDNSLRRQMKRNEIERLGALREHVEEQRNRTRNIREFDRLDNFAHSIAEKQDDIDNAFGLKKCFKRSKKKTRRSKRTNRTKRTKMTKK